MQSQSTFRQKPEKIYSFTGGHSSSQAVQPFSGTRYILLDRPYGTVQYEQDENGFIYLHLALTDFSLSLYKMMQNDMTDILTKFRELGVTRLFVVIPADDPKLLKFEESFGFGLLHTDVEHNFLILGQDTQWD